MEALQGPMSFAWLAADRDERLMALARSKLPEETLEQE